MKCNLVHGIGQLSTPSMFEGPGLVNSALMACERLRQPPPGRLGARYKFTDMGPDGLSRGIPHQSRISSGFRPHDSISSCVTNKESESGLCVGRFPAGTNAVVTSGWKSLTLRVAAFGQGVLVQVRGWGRITYWQFSSIRPVGWSQIDSALPTVDPAG